MAKILLVEDDKTTISILDTLLTAEGYDVITSENGEQAKALIAENEFDLMISDIRMAPVDGMQLLQAIHEEEPDVAVIMLTAYGSVETAIDALKLGAFDYVTKPFKVDELLITVQRALEYRRARSENIDLRAQLEAALVRQMQHCWLWAADHRWRWDGELPSTQHRQERQERQRS